jgi:hypothetical protein
VSRFSCGANLESVAASSPPPLRFRFKQTNFCNDQDLFCFCRTKEEASIVLINHGERTRVSLQLGGLLKHLKDSDPQPMDQWEASSSVLRPGNDAGSGLTTWAQPLVQGHDVDTAAMTVDVDVPSLSITSLRIKRTSKKEVRHTFAVVRSDFENFEQFLTRGHLRTGVSMAEVHERSVMEENVKFIERVRTRDTSQPRVKHERPLSGLVYKRQHFVKARACVIRNGCLI